MRSLINPKIMLLTIVFHKFVALFILQSASLYYSPLPKKSCNYRSNYGSKQNQKNPNPRRLIQDKIWFQICWVSIPGWSHDCYYMFSDKNLFFFKYKDKKKIHANYKDRENEQMPISKKQFSILPNFPN